jgi:hypothetical protein
MNISRQSLFVICSLLVSVPIVLIFFIQMISNGERNTANSTIQNITYEDPSLGIRMEYPASWKPIEKTPDSTHLNITEFIPIVQSEHQPLTPYFSILIENVNNTGIPLKSKQDFIVDQGIIDGRLESLATREITKLNETFPDFNIVELIRTFSLSDIPAYKMVYTFADPGSPTYPVYESVRVCAIEEGKVYTISFTADESVFLDHLPTIQNMIGSFTIINNL